MGDLYEESELRPENMIFEHCTRCKIVFDVEALETWLKRQSGREESGLFEYANRSNYLI